MKKNITRGIKRRIGIDDFRSISHLRRRKKLLARMYSFVFKNMIKFHNNNRTKHLHFVEEEIFLDFLERRLIKAVELKVGGVVVDWKPKNLALAA